MRIPGFTAFAIASVLAAGPSVAQDVTGNWTCTMAGAPAGTLAIDDAGYAYTAHGASSAVTGTYSIDTNMLTVASGPLLDALGIRLGFVNTTLTHQRWRSTWGRARA